MQVHLPNRDIRDSANLATATFHVPPSAMGKLAHTFITGLYSDPTRFVYEIAANAIDANPVGVKVTLPTALSKSFIVEDAGPGMSREFMFGEFCQILSSTKDGDDKSIGGYGVGRLSPLGICDSYLVETQGASYLVRKDHQGVPEVAHVGPSKVTGTRVTVGVPPGKVGDVRAAANEALRWYDPPVECNLNIERPEILFGSRELGWAWRRLDERAKATLVMGGYPYPLALTEVDGVTYRWDHSWRNLVLFADPGFASVTANRQSLTYDDRTKANIKERLDKMRLDLGAQVGKEIAACPTIFEAKRKLAQAVSQLPVRPQDVQYRGKVLDATIGGDVTGLVWVSEVGRRSRDIRKLTACEPRHTAVPERFFVYEGDTPPKGSVAKLNHAGYASVILLRVAQADELEVPAANRVKVEDLPKPPPQARGSSAPARWWRACGTRGFEETRDRPAHAYYVRFEKGDPVWRDGGYSLVMLLQGFAAFPHELYGIPKSGKVPAGWTEFTPQLVREHVKIQLELLGDVGRLLAIEEAWKEVPAILQRMVDSDIPTERRLVAYRRLVELRALPKHDSKAIGEKLQRVGLPPLQLPRLKAEDDPRKLTAQVLELRPMLKLLERLYPSQEQYAILGDYIR